jgi:hypothetical protein
MLARAALAASFVLVAGNAYAVRRSGDFIAHAVPGYAWDTIGRPTWTTAGAVWLADVGHLQISAREASARQTLETGRPTSVALDRPTFDADGSPGAGTDPGRLIAPVNGRYLVLGMAPFAGNQVGSRKLEAIVDDETRLATREVLGATGGPTYVTVGGAYDLRAGDAVALRATQTSGGSLDLVAVGSLRPRLVLIHLPDAAHSISDLTADADPVGLGLFWTRAAVPAEQAVADDIHTKLALRALSAGDGTFDQVDMHLSWRDERVVDDGASVSRLVARVPGRYLIVADVSLESRRFDARRVELGVNGATAAAQTAVGRDPLRLVAAAVYDMIPGDVVELAVTSHFRRAP